MASLDTATATAAPAAESYRFDVEDEGWLDHLSREGYVIIKAVAGPEELARARSLVWDALEATTPAKRDDLGSWEAWKLDKRGFSMHGTVTQGEGAWLVRALPGVRRAFEGIWKTADLICSMDQVLIWRPWWRSGGSKWIPKTEGLHTDQNPIRKSGFCCVQGMVPLYDVTGLTGGLEVVPSSHLPPARDALAARCGEAELRALGDFCRAPPGHHEPSEARLVLAAAGDLILWDSRTMHGGKVGTGAGDDGGEGAQLARLTIPICMTPRSMASDQVSRDRLAMFAEGKTTNHWPHEPRVQNQVSLGYVPIELSPAQRALL